MEDVTKGLLRPGSWVVQGTLGLAYPGSFESHVCLAEWWVGSIVRIWMIKCLCAGSAFVALSRGVCRFGGAARAWAVGGRHVI